MRTGSSDRLAISLTDQGMTAHDATRGPGASTLVSQCLGTVIETAGARSAAIGRGSLPGTAANSGPSFETDRPRKDLVRRVAEADLDIESSA